MNEKRAPWCSQCGQYVDARSCGPTHALLLHEWQLRNAFINAVAQGTANYVRNALRELGMHKLTRDDRKILSGAIGAALAEVEHESADV